MKISIITPSYNQAQYIEQTIDSVLSQNYKNLEYIIIDGGSNDRSVDIIKKYDKHLAYWISERDRGQSHALNKGIRMASGEIINWLNSDDYYEPNSFKIIANAFTDPRVKAFCAKSNIVQDGQFIRQSNGTDIYDGQLEKTIGCARIDQPETFFRKGAFYEVGFLNENLHYTMDREWWIRYLIKCGLGGILKSDECIVNFRLQPQSKTVSQSQEFNKETIAIYYSLAMRAGCTELVNKIGEVFNIKLDSHFYSGDPIPSDRAKRILNYFVLQQSHQAYFHLEFNLAKELTTILQPELISDEDRKLARKIILRSSLPKWLIKSLRR